MLKYADNPQRIMQAGQPKVYKESYLGRMCE